MWVTTFDLLDRLGGEVILEQLPDGILGLGCAATHWNLV